MRRFFLFLAISAATLAAGGAWPEGRGAWGATPKKPVDQSLLTSAATSMRPDEQAHARKLYVSKCAKCHKFYEPRAYTDADWNRWMVAMGKKSKLKQTDLSLLKQYLDGYRAGELPPPAKR